MESTKRSTHEAGAFVKGLRETAVKGGTFDSAAADDFVAVAINQNSGVKVPEGLQITLDEAGEHRSLITRAILDGCAEYEARHGFPMPDDVAEYGFHLAYGLTADARRKIALDSTSLHGDNLSLQPNRAVVSILSAFSEAIPFAHYLPADISSNEARLAILSHVAGNTYGQYDQNANMDGANSGGRFISSARIHSCAVAAADGAITGKLTPVQTDSETCAAGAGDLKLMRGRSIVYVNGDVVATEISKSGAGNSAVSGAVTIAGVEYQIGGYINTDTGVIAMTSTPKLPVTNKVHVEGFIDYERDASIVPRIITQVDMYSLFASPYRCNTTVTPDSRTQMSSELGLDPYAESVIAIQSQVANERHFDVLYKAARLGGNNQQDFDFAWATMGAQKVRAQVWQDFAYVLGVVSQQMAIDTMNHGVTHLYVGKRVAAQFRGMPSELFQPSGISERPGIYRVGRLFGAYDVYYSPSIAEGTTTAQILCIGKATDVTRNPFILGDAAPPTIKPLSVGTDLNEGAGYYARNFTAVNPHKASARGAALINIINM